jgi:uncharacterized RDD family membrane protein YckC
MSWPPAGGDPPTPDPAVPEPDAETARVPIEPALPTAPPSGAEPPAPPSEPAIAPPLTPDAPSPTPTGIISAQPVGLPGSVEPPVAGPTSAQPNVPVGAWVVPTAQAVTQVGEGLVVAGVFARVVAYVIDALILGSINLAIFGALGLFDTNRDETLVLIASIVVVGIDFAYFVGLWTSAWHGSLGMRLLGLRVLGAVSHGGISLNDALLRWLALSGALAILALVPGVGRYIGLLEIAWFLILLFTTASTQLHQGLHDRWARTVVAQRAPGGSGAAIVGCLALVVIVGVVIPLAIVALAGDQLQDILIEIGKSV